MLNRILQWGADFWDVWEQDSFALKSGLKLYMISWVRKWGEVVVLGVRVCMCAPGQDEVSHCYKYEVMMINKGNVGASLAVQ